MEYIQETATLIPKYVFTMALSPNAPWDEEEGLERKTEGECEFKGDISPGFFSVPYRHEVLEIQLPST